MFASEWGREKFAKIMLASLAGMLLPWFRIDRGLYLWGVYGLPFVMIQAMLIAVFCSKVMEEKASRRIFPVVTELLLITFPIIYFCLMMSWNTPFCFFDDCFWQGFYSALPTFWIAFALAFIPIFAFPFLRRWKKEKVESNVLYEKKGIFTSQWSRKIFMKTLYISWLGMLLPWFSFDPNMEGYTWGFSFFPYVMLQVAGLVVLFHNEPNGKIGSLIASVFTEICLISFPAIYIWQMLTWYIPYVSVDSILETSLSVTYPPFWISLVLSIIPIFAFPILRRWKKEEVK